MAWHADPAGKTAQPRQGTAAISSEQVFGHAVDGRAVADLGGRGALGREQGAVASARSPALSRVAWAAAMILGSAAGIWS